MSKSWESVFSKSDFILEYNSTRKSDMYEGIFVQCPKSKTRQDMVELSFGKVTKLVSGSTECSSVWHQDNNVSVFNAGIFSAKEILDRFDLNFDMFTSEIYVYINLIRVNNNNRTMKLYSYEIETFLTSSDDVIVATLMGAYS